jgi:hypothetical protein
MTKRVGRKPLPKGEAKNKAINIRVTEGQKELFESLRKKGDTTTSVLLSCAMVGAEILQKGRE